MTRFVIWASLVATPLVWALNVQLGQLLPYLDCSRHTRLSAIVSAVATVIAVGAGLLALQNVSRAGVTAGRTMRFVVNLGGLMSLLFAFALVLQFAAGVVLSGCER